MFVLFTQLGYFLPDIYIYWFMVFILIFIKLSNQQISAPIKTSKISYRLIFYLILSTLCEGLK